MKLLNNISHIFLGLGWLCLIFAVIVGFAYVQDEGHPEQQILTGTVFYYLSSSILPLFFAGALGGAIVEIGEYLKPKEN